MSRKAIKKGQKYRVTFVSNDNAELGLLPGWIVTTLKKKASGVWLVTDDNARWWISASHLEALPTPGEQLKLAADEMIACDEEYKAAHERFYTAYANAQAASKAYQDAERRFVRSQIAEAVGTPPEDTTFTTGGPSVPADAFEKRHPQLLAGAAKVFGIDVAVDSSLSASSLSVGYCDNISHRIADALRKNVAKIECCDISSDGIKAKIIMPNVGR